MSQLYDGPYAKLHTGNTESPSSDPANSKYHLRFALDSFLTLARTTPSGSTTLSGMVIEISAVGMSAIVPEQLQLGERVTLDCELIVGNLTIDGIVQYSHKFRHGFRFVDVNAEQQRQIQEACARLRVYCRDKGDCIEWKELHRHSGHAAHQPGDSPKDRVTRALRSFLSRSAE